MNVAILGAGPAGMSCANACLSFGLTPLVIEHAAHAGGAQRSNFHSNLWLLGAPDESGQALTQRLVAHYATLNVRTRYQTDVTSAQRTATGIELTLTGPAGATTETVEAVVIATGMRPYATPALIALATHSPRVLIGPLNDTIRDDIRAARVLILGGGDNALDHALFLAERGNRVTVATRGTYCGRESLLAACRACPEITLLPHCPLRDLNANARGVQATLGEDPASFDWLLVMYGYRPNTELLHDFALELQPALTSGGHLIVDAWQRTSVVGLYAAGDVTETVQPAIPTAMAQGLAAAKAIERDGKAGRLKG